VRWDRLHRKAVEAGQRFYIDPATGAYVFTELEHKARGTCCGRRCRHCPFEHVNVPGNQPDEA